MRFPTRKEWRRLNLVTHRDVGYFVSSLVIAYCLSGLALNHADVWNPDFIIRKKDITVPVRAAVTKLEPAEVAKLGELVGESHYRVVDYPTPTQVKIYYQDATLHVDYAAGTGHYERIARRPLFYEVNALHLNSFKPWRWASDIFATSLILVSVTGLLMLRGSKGIGGRGKWFILAGLLPPLVVIVLHG